MDFDLNTIDAYGSLLGGVASVISLVGLLFAVSEIRRARSIVDRETDHRIYEMMLDIDRFFVEHSELRPYIRGSATIPDGCRPGSAEHHQIFAAIEMMLDFMECAYTQLDLMPIHQRIGWINYFIEVSRTSPLLCQYVQDECDSYMPAFVHLIVAGEYDPRLDKLDARAQWQQLNRALSSNRWQAWHQRIVSRRSAS